MSYFTDSAFERMMVQKPTHRKERKVEAPKGHLCHGCERYGMYCVHPCHREAQAKAEKAVKPCNL